MIDLAIIGGGPAGYVAAERAGAAGLSVVLFEKNALGGVCLNEGCIPTKTLLYGAKTYENALSADKYGVSATDVSFDFGRMVARKNKVVRKLVLGVAAKMKAHGVEVVRGEATIAGREEGGFRISLGDGNGGASAASGSASASASAAAAAAAAMSGDGYVAKNLLICTGSEAFVPPIPGLAEGLGAPAADDAEGARGVMTAREILALKERPESLVIIGGGVIGMEFASLYNSLGTSVTVVEMLPEILGGMDSEIAATLREMYTKKGVAFRLGCRVVRIEGRDDDASRNGEGRRVVWTDAEGGESSADGDVVLVSIGRRPVTRGFGLENLGVELTRGGGIVVDQRMRTSVAGVWAAGDVTGFSMLAHTASREGEVAVGDIVNSVAGSDSNSCETMSYSAIPGVVYTNPEVAAVGLTLDGAVAAGHVGARELTLPMAYSGRFVAENEGGAGLCKIVVAADDKLLGVHLLGGPAGEMIWGAAASIERGDSLAELRRVIFPHPTVAEIIRETLFSD